MPERRVSYRGFTLVELLASSTVLFVGLSVLVPALSSDRNEEQKAACLTNLRELGMLSAAYAQDDPNGVIGPVHPLASSFTGEGYAEYGGGPGTMNYVGWDDEFDPRTRLFNHLLYGHNGVTANTSPGDRSVFRVYQCPGEELGWQQWPGWGSSALETENPYYQANGTSFRMNNLAYTSGQSLGTYGRPSEQVPVPGATLHFMEPRAYQTIWTNDHWGTLTHGELSGYHRARGFFNAVYVDGHASLVDFGDGTYFDHLTWPDHPEYQAYDVRGTWGRMDCLPEALLHN